MKQIAQNVIDAYRADAAERSAYIRTLEQRNRVLEAQDAVRSRELLFARDQEESTFILGALLGGSLFGTAMAIEADARVALVIFGSLSAVLFGIRIALRRFARGTKP